MYTHISIWNLCSALRPPPVASQRQSPDWQTPQKYGYEKLLLHDANIYRYLYVALPAVKLAASVTRLGSKRKKI